MGENKIGMLPRPEFKAGMISVKPERHCFSGILCRSTAYSAMVFSFAETLMGFSFQISQFSYIDEIARPLFRSGFQYGSSQDSHESFSKQLRDVPARVGG
jgi:hypothetical protein